MKPEPEPRCGVGGCGWNWKPRWPPPLPPPPGKPKRRKNSLRSSSWLSPEAERPDDTTSTFTTEAPAFATRGAKLGRAWTRAGEVTGTCCGTDVAAALGAGGCCASVLPEQAPSARVSARTETARRAGLEKVMRHSGGIGGRNGPAWRN